MFWGIVLENGKRYTQVVDDGFHISMAALEPQLDKKGKANNDSPVSVMMEREKTEFLLCTLNHGKRPQQALDLNFAEGEAVTLFLNGEGIVHLTGYVVEDPEDAEYSYGEEDEEDISDVESEDLDAMYEAEGKAIKRKSSPIKAIDSSNKKPKMSSSDEDSSSLGDEFDDSEAEEAYKQLMLKHKQSQSPKKSAIKAAAVGAPWNSKQSPSPPKKVTITETPKSENKPNGGPKTPMSEKQQKKGPQTPATNGQKSPDDSLSASAKKKRRRNKKKSLGSPEAASPKANSEKTPGKGQINAEKTPSKGQNKSEKTPGKGQNNADKTPAKIQKKLLPGGVILEDLQVGDGPEAKQGKMVHVHYIGKLASNNKEFDSCLKGQQPFKFRLGKNEVIKGWDIGLEGMKVGGRRKLVIPPHQGYGNKHMGTIPPNSTLNFEVQLVSVS